MSHNKPATIPLEGAEEEQQRLESQVTSSKNEGTDTKASALLKDLSEGNLAFLSHKTCKAIVLHKTGEAVVTDHAFSKKAREDFRLHLVAANNNHAKSLSGATLPECITGVFVPDQIPDVAYLEEETKERGALALIRGRDKNNAGFVVTKEKSKTACLIYARKYSEDSGTEFNTIVTATKPAERENYAKEISRIMKSDREAACLLFACIPERHLTLTLTLRFIFFF